MDGMDGKDGRGVRVMRVFQVRVECVKGEAKGASRFLHGMAENAGDAMEKVKKLMSPEEVATSVRPMFTLEF